MEVERRPSPLAFRVASAWRSRGPRYVAHKAMRRAFERWPALKRRFVYADPREYWTLRGGPDYFAEQEDHPTRALRAAWVADRIAACSPSSILEVGCGYGKLLRLLAERLSGVPITGVDFSPTQLAQAKHYLAGVDNVTLTHASGARLPFADQTFDLVVTSAVILHNPPPVAEAIRREVVRVSSRLTAHNEDVDASYNRYGYDTAGWYHAAGVRVIECGPIGVEADVDREVSQFCLAEPWPR